jgi:hypothetical protein
MRRAAAGNKALRIFRHTLPPSITCQFGLLLTCVGDVRAMRNYIRRQNEYLHAMLRYYEPNQR